MTLNAGFLRKTSIGKHTLLLISFYFQTRRLGIRYKAKDGEVKYAHSLNNTGIATPRILIPLLENNQQKDGSIKMPKALHKYLGFKEIKKKID